MSIPTIIDIDYVKQEIASWWDALNPKQRGLFIAFTQCEEFEDMSAKFEELSLSMQNFLLSHFLSECKRDYV